MTAKKAPDLWTGDLFGGLALVPQVVAEARVVKGGHSINPPAEAPEEFPFLSVDGEWLIAVPPLARKLTVEKTETLLRRVPPQWKRKATVNTKGGPQPTWCVTWDGFGLIVQRSNKPEAYALQERMAALLGKDIRSRMGIQEPAIVPMSSGIGGDKLAEALLGMEARIASRVIEAIRPELIADTNDRVQRIEETAVQTLSEVRDVRNNLPIERKDLTAETKDKHRQTVRQFTNGCCPRCRFAKVLDQSGQWAVGSFDFDHWYRRDKNGLRQTWPLCKPCHAAVTADAGLRDEWSHNWWSYLELIDLIEQPLLRGVG